MAKITMEIQFGCLSDGSNYKKKKINEIEKVISEICDKYYTECDDYYLDCIIIESFFDVYYDYSENPDNSEENLNEILEFLSELKIKYPNSDLDWYISEQTFDNEEDSD